MGPPALTSAIPSRAIQGSTQEGITVACYPDEIPGFVEQELVRLYGCIFSSLQHFRIYGGTERIGTYVARQGDRVVSVLLFRIEHRKARVLNEFIRLGEQEIIRFTETIFAAFPSVRSVSFNAIELKPLRLPFPAQRFNCSEDIALALPGTADDYLARLGKATRKNIKHHLSRLRRHFPSLRFDVYSGADAGANEVHAIIALNRLRMAEKQKTSYLDEWESERLLRLAQSCGLVTVLTIDGRICAGAICARVGDNYFSYVTAHDPAFDAYRLGTLCCYLTICEAIRRRGREFHLLWGRYQYKYMLGGVQRDLDHLDIYRTHGDFVLHGGTALMNACGSFVRQAKSRLADPDRHNIPMLRPVLDWLRQMRHPRPHCS